MSITVTSRFDDTSLTLERGGEVIFQRKVSLTPVQPFFADVDLDLKGKGKPIAVNLITREGREILSWRTDLPIDGNSDFQPARRPVLDPAVASSPEQAWRDGMAADKKSNDVSARTAWREALKRDPGFTPALVSLGLSFYRTGEYEEAWKQVSSALRRDKDATGADYCAALVLRALGRDREATDHLFRMVRAGRDESLARYLLGEIALAAGDTNEALEHLGQALKFDPRDLKARTMLALALRITGKMEEAQVQIEAAVHDLPLDYFALHERYTIYRTAGKIDDAKRSWDELWRVLSREPDSVLELAFDYLAVNRSAEPRAILEEALRRCAQVGHPAYPMLNYTLGYLLERSGEIEAARAQYALGSKGNPNFVFPHRVEEIVVLKAASAANPRDPLSFYCLGNVLAAKGRAAEAIQAWSTSLNLDGKNAVAWRNLALGLWKTSGNKRGAVDAYERAITLAPEEYHHYIEFDALLAAMTATERRIRLLEGAPAAVRAHSPAVQALAAAYVDAGRFTDAVRLLQRAKITSGEGESGALATYRRACRGLAANYRKDGKHSEAAAEIIKATQYPPNLGVGRSSTESMAREYVAAARELEAAGQVDAALTLWRKAAAQPLRAPSEPVESWSENYYWKAFALERSGQKDEARALFTRLAALADDRRMELREDMPPEGAIRFLLAGLSLKALGRSVEARTMLGRALKLDPSNELARSELAALPKPR
jgi:tetratricopeptide (TPR) repeat protein